MMGDSKLEPRLESKPYERWPDGQSYRLPHFPNGKIPDKVVLTEHAKKVFELSRNGQGLVGIAWLGKDENNNDDVLYIDLLPAFNKDDGKLKCDKNGREFGNDESVESDQPFGTGANTGVVHQSFIKIIERRIALALKQSSSQDAMIKQYEGTCVIIGQNNQCFLNVKKMFGFGILKGYIYNLELISPELMEDRKKAKDGIIYLSEDGTYIVRDPHGNVQTGKVSVDLRNLPNRLNDSELKKTILAITSEKGHTKDKYDYLLNQLRIMSGNINSRSIERDPEFLLRDYFFPEMYDLQLMSADVMENKNKAEDGTLYLSEDGIYIVRDPQKKIQTGRVNVDLIEDLPNRLNDYKLKISILEITSKAGHTYHEDDMNDSTKRKEFYIKRALPRPIVLRIQQALLEGLLPGNLNIQRKILDISIPSYLDSYFQEWQTVKNNPEENIKGLLLTLRMFFSLEQLEIEKMKEIICWIRHEALLMSEKNLPHSGSLEKILSGEFDGGSNIFEMANNLKNYEDRHAIISYFNQCMSSEQNNQENIFNEEKLYHIAQNGPISQLFEMLKSFDIVQIAAVQTTLPRMIKKIENGWDFFTIIELLKLNEDPGISYHDQIISLYENLKYQIPHLITNADLFYTYINSIPPIQGRHLYEQLNQLKKWPELIKARIDFAKIIHYSSLNPIQIKELCDLLQTRSPKFIKDIEDFVNVINHMKNSGLSQDQITAVYRSENVKTILSDTIKTKNDFDMIFCSRLEPHQVIEILSFIQPNEQTNKEIQDIKKVFDSKEYQQTVLLLSEKEIDNSHNMSRLKRIYRDHPENTSLLFRNLQSASKFSTLTDDSFQSVCKDYESALDLAKQIPIDNFVKALGLTPSDKAKIYSSPNSRDFAIICCENENVAEQIVRAIHLGGISSNKLEIEHEPATNTYDIVLEINQIKNLSNMALEKISLLMQTNEKHNNEVKKEMAPKKQSFFSQPISPEVQNLAKSLGLSSLELWNVFQTKPHDYERLHDLAHYIINYNQKIHPALSREQAVATTDEEKLNLMAGYYQIEKGYLTIDEVRKLKAVEREIIFTGPVEAADAFMRLQTYRSLFGGQVP